MIVLELCDRQAEETIRDLLRAVVLLDRASIDSEDPLHRHACLCQSKRLADLARDLEDRWAGRGSRELARR